MRIKTEEKDENKKRAELWELKKGKDKNKKTIFDI